VPLSSGFVMVPSYVNPGPDTAVTSVKRRQVTSAWRSSSHDQTSMAMVHTKSAPGQPLCQAPMSEGKVAARGLLFGAR
jgi:hypothetical protein